MKIPKKKTWSKIAVLQSVADSFIFDQASDNHLPLNNNDFYPGTTYKRFDIDEAVDHGISTNNEVKKALPNYYSLEWIESHDTFKHRVCDPPPSVNDSMSQLVKKPSCENLEHLLDAREPSLAQQMYMKLLEMNVVIPQELVEKTFALICFDLLEFQISPTKYVRKEKIKEDYGQLIEMFKSSQNPSPSLHCTMIRAAVKQRMSRTAVLQYNKMRKQGFAADLTTLNLLLGAALRYDSNHVNDKFLFSILEDLNTRQIKPTMETFCAFIGFVAMFKKNKVEEVLQEWSKCLREMEILGLEQNLVLFGSLLTAASEAIQNKELVNAILDIIEQRRFRITGHFSEYSAFHEAMRFAYITRDLELAKRIWDIAMSDCYRSLHLLDVVNFKFYEWYFITVCYGDTVESVLDVCHKMIGTKVYLIGETRDALLLSAIRHKCPQLLPYIFSELEMKSLKDSDALAWLKTALRIVQYADAQTKQQFSNIVMVVLDIMKIYLKANADLLSDLCMLLALCSSENKVENIFTFLGVCKKTYPYISLSPKALEKCHEAVRNNKQAVAKLRSLHPVR